MFLGQLLLIILLKFCLAEDFYELLGVPRDANNQEIRKAFKKVALKLHPDKNVDDPDAHDNFLKITRAYEILKQPETRKHYDLHGDTGNDYNDFDRNRPFRSYAYYRDHFGIYDDDPIIVTLSKSDYEINVLDDTQAWFVNFYSPQCHHCHELAPAWRKIAREFQGVIRIAAVNCEDDWGLCYQLNIGGYPSLMYYDRQSNIYEGEKYTGRRTFEALEEYILNKVKIEISTISSDKWNHLNTALLFLCPDDNINCPERKTQSKLAVALEGVVEIFLVKDEPILKEISIDYVKNSIIFWKNGEVTIVEGSDFEEIMTNVLNILPNPDVINEEQFDKIQSDLQSGSAVPWLFCFYMGPATELNLQLKRLPALLSNLNLGLVHCGRSSKLCSRLHVPRYPAWGVLKVGGAFELHHGMDVLHEVTAFVKDSVKSTNLQSLSPDDFDRIKGSDEKWFVDWYAPWCPPCKKLMPEMRKASQHFDEHDVRFGTIDCTVFRNLCTREGITSYPTTAFYANNSIRHFHGVMSEDSIVEFVEDMLHPLVIELTESNFAEKLMRKPADQMWFVDFYAPWCGPCQKLSNEWRKLAKQMRDFTNINVAQLDCVSNHELCSSHKVRAYPTLRLYPLGSKGLNTVVMYNGNRDLLSLKRWLLNFIPSNVTSLSGQDFQNIDTLTMPILIDFYAPWCGHCTIFETAFRKVADLLKGYVECAKLDCQAENRACHDAYVNSYPTVMLYLTSERRYEIQSRDVEGIVTRVKELFGSEILIEKHDEL